jgi:hypothetical protein
MTTEPQTVIDTHGRVNPKIVHMSTLCNRYLLQVEAAKGPITPMTLELISATPTRPGLAAPHHRWPDVLRSVAIAIAEERMRRLEPGEAVKFDEFAGEVRKLRRECKGHGQAKEKAVELETNRRRAVFLSRWFPVPPPAPRVWNYGAPNALTTWSPAELGGIAENLLGMIETGNPVEPSWYPDGWRDSVKALGGAS